MYGARNGTTLAGSSSGISGTNASYFNEPTGLDLDSNGNIFIPDTRNSRVQFWTKDSVTGQTIAGTGTFKENTFFFY